MRGGGEITPGLSATLTLRIMEGLPVIQDFSFLIRPESRWLAGQRALPDAR
jgi:hypothetical protein